MTAAALLLLLLNQAFAQGSREDYQRALSVRQLAQNKVFRDVVKPHWLPDSTRFWYQVQTGPKEHEFVMVDAAAGTRTPAFDHARLADALVTAGAARVRREALTLSGLTFDAAASTMTFRFDGRSWECSFEDYVLKEVPPKPAGAGQPLKDMPGRSRGGGEETGIIFINRTRAEVKLWWISTDGERRSYGSVPPGGRHSQHTFEGHVWMVSDAAGKPMAWTIGERTPTEFEITGDAPDGGRETSRKSGKTVSDKDSRGTAFIKDHNVWLRDSRTREQTQLSFDGSATNAYKGQFHWSPDGRRLVVVQEEPAQEHTVHVVESSPKDQVQPKLHSFNYLKPGDRIAHPRVRMFDVEARRPVEVGDDLFPTPWSIGGIRWLPGGRECAFLYNQRGHQRLCVLAVHADTGKVRTIVEERSDTFIDYSQKMFLHWLDASGEMLWMSERDGWNHLWLHDVASGEVKRQVTRGPWVVRRVERVDEAARQVWFWAGGAVSGQDPYHQHLCRVNLDGTGFIVLTPGDGMHSVEFSPDRELFIDTWSRVDLPPVTELRRSGDGSLVCALERADASALLAAGWKVPERFVARGRDGRTDIFGIIIKPSRFDPAVNYPVIEEIYAGPHGAFVPKAWGLQPRQHAMAELGFVVVQIDGMGTNWRSREFHDVAWKNLKDAGFPDRIAWIKAAAATRSWMDLSRVGIYGGSAGGQNTLSGLLHHGEFYKAGVADCGCHDNRMDKIWWNEAWMGWPVDASYADNSNVTHAHKLTGKLMLVVGELDRNVDPASTMQVADALVKADKDFDLLVVPGAGHGAAETPYASRRRMDFFVRHLHGREPRW